MFTGIQLYEGGADPLPWPSILKAMKKDNRSWKEIADELLVDVNEEIDVSEWSEDSEEEDDDDEFDECVDEQEESEHDAVSEVSELEENWVDELWDEVDDVPQEPNAKRVKLL